MTLRRLSQFSGVTLLAAFVLAGCKEPLPPATLARVGDREIRVDEFTRELEGRQRGNPAPVDARALLDELVVRETYAQAARKAGLENDAEVQRLVRDVLIARLKERELVPKLEAVKVTDAEVRSAYEARRAEFATPERAHLAVLFLQSRERLENAESQIRQVSFSEQRTFGALAVEFSEDQSTRYRGGDIGWVQRERYPQRIERAVIDAGLALKEPGAVSGVIRGERGFYLVKLIERQAASVQAFDQVAPALQADLLRGKREQVEREFVTRTRESIPVEVHPERLPATATPAANHLPKLP